MQGERLQVGDLLQRAWLAVSAAAPATVAFVVAMSAAGSVIDIYAGDGAGAFILFMAASVVAGYFLIRALLRGSDLVRPGEGGGFGLYFGVSFLASLGIFFGLLFLVVPGIILWIRWCAAYAWIVGEGAGANPLGESWEMTRGNFWPILAAALVGLAPFAVGAIVVSAGSLYYAAAEGETTVTVLETVASNLMSAAYSVFSTALGVAVYWSRRVDRRGLSEVFA